ncbi:hypothetical protein MSP7336_01838 [Mycobacterium shimoidei]|uniref:Uncharacterized protein n=1 Tax=Mycobacterium shimoidei TaxID=29313 RepID=A0A375YXK3_MYCSH|nr:hypothetical protein [Mycobacterium shimoidei]SRX93599.1 hypothetical protein MSP7336_01838 [Mycobacterium shimoidei]
MLSLVLRAADAAVNAFVETMRSAQLWPDFDEDAAARYLNDTDQTSAAPVLPPGAAAESPEADMPRRADPPAPAASGHPLLFSSTHPRLFVAAAIGLREWADHPACEAPAYWRILADQLDDLHAETESLDNEPWPPDVSWIEFDSGLRNQNPNVIRKTK